MKHPLKRSEHDEQCVVIEWATYNTPRYPELRMLYAVPNGGERHPAVAEKLRVEGVQRGVPDLCLPVARGFYHGCYLEMKVGRNKPSKDQERWIADLKAFGYRVEVCYSADEAIAELEAYLLGSARPADAVKRTKMSGSEATHAA